MVLPNVVECFHNYDNYLWGKAEWPSFFFAEGRGQRAEGRGHGAWSMEHGAWGMGCGVWGVDDGEAECLVLK